MRMTMVAVLLAPLLLALAGCGGDNLALCDGCTTPTPQASLTVTPSAATATITPAATVPSATVTP